MSKVPINRDGEDGIFRFDRREFITAGLALAATAMFPRIAVSAPEKQPVVSARRKDSTPAQIALAWLLAQKPWIVPIPGTTNLQHLDENLGALPVKFTPEEFRELNAAASKIVVHGERLRKELLVMSGREAPLRN
jgi:diketogulonate reductase-like aldo/keto reductase